MPSISKTGFACGLAFLLVCGRATAATLPNTDQRGRSTQTLNTLRTFPAIGSKSEWQSRAKEIREQVLVSCGLWPLPEKTPLHAVIAGKVVRDGYSVEKVYFQTYPGFYLGGNLYRPVGRGDGPFPAILNPHGHWAHGRLEDTADCSVAARCIQFARQGMIALSYDMVGYNDTKQVTHRFASAPKNMLWNINLMGLQTWNSIRALDFLETLPDADKSRFACTGASGGGTQTFTLGAVDERLAAQAPIVMVSHSMQGGCLCEYAPGLRVDYSNMEIAAAPAPRPQILVAATGDWTKDTPTVEGPAIEGIYRLFDAADRLRYVRFDFGHNYNRTSREAVYEWFGRWLLREPNSTAPKEAAYQKEPDQDLRVWPDGQMPPDALSEEALIRSLADQAQNRWLASKPTDRRSLERYQSIWMPAWRHTLLAEFPERGLLIEAGEPQRISNCTMTKFAIGRSGRGDRIPTAMFNPRNDSHRLVVVLAHPQGMSACLDEAGVPRGLAKRVLDNGNSVVVADAFLTGSLANPELENARKPLANQFTAYNRTDLQERVQDLLTLAAFAQTHSKGRRVVLVGSGQAGLWILLAAPVVDAVVADCDQIDPSDEAALLASNLFIPGIRRLGAFAGVATLAAPHPIFLHNTGEKFSTAWLRDIYQAVGGNALYQAHSEKVSDDAAARWIGQLRWEN